MFTRGLRSCPGHPDLKSKEALFFFFLGSHMISDAQCLNTQVRGGKKTNPALEPSKDFVSIYKVRGALHFFKPSYFPVALKSSPGAEFALCWGCSGQNESCRPWLLGAATSR